jgi:hypothetical protein
LKSGNEGVLRCCGVRLPYFLIGKDKHILPY